MLVSGTDPEVGISLVRPVDLTERFLSFWLADSKTKKVSDDDPNHIERGCRSKYDSAELEELSPENTRRDNCVIISDESD